MTTPLRIELPVGQLGRLTGQTETLPPIIREDDGSGGPLDTPQIAARIGDAVPVVFGRLRGALPEGQRGGVTISPAATDANFSNDSLGAITARYQLLLGEGEMGSIQVRDVFQGGVRVGALTQAYSRRAGDWGPGRALVPWGSNPAPDAPSFVGDGQGSFAGVTMGSFTVTRPAGVETWKAQVQAFIREGMTVHRFVEDDEGPSDSLADLVVWALLRTGRVSAQLVDSDSMLAAGEFLEENKLTFNARRDSAEGLLDWLTEVLPHYLLRLVRVSGIYRLRPLLPTLAGGAINTGATVATMTFTVADLEPSSISLSAIPAGDRRPIAVLVQWRQQLENAESFVRTTTVRYGGSALAGPYEQVDLSSYATNVIHAVTYGAFRLARRRYIDHRLTFRLRPDADSNAIAEGDIVRVILSVTTDAGEARIDQFYTVEQLSRSPAGVASLELLHYPVDADGKSLIALDVSSAATGAVDLPVFIGSGWGRVGLDENSYLDTTVSLDMGPWDGWDPPLNDLELYAPGEELPAGVKVPEILPPGSEPSGSISPLNPSPVPPGAVPPIGDGWGPGRIPISDLGGLDDLGYVAAVSFEDVRITYPDVWYLINTTGAVGVRARVTVDNPPVDRALQLVISDGLLEAAATVTISIGETTAELPDGLTSRTDTPGDDAERSLSVSSWTGGGYRVAPGTDPPLALTATPSTFTVKAYVGTVTLLPPGLWEWLSSVSEWMWAGTADLGEWEWDQDLQRWEWNGTSTGWDWVPADQRWSYIGSVPTGWAWRLVEQRWQRTSTATAVSPRPEGSPSSPPSPVPASTPPAGYYTVVARASVSPVPIVSQIDDLVLYLRDSDEVASESAGTLTIPAVSMWFGNWRWVPAESWWVRGSPDANWRWDPVDVTWEYLADPDGWTWNQSTGTWEGGTGLSPSGPPIQGGSVQPPDGEMWTYDPDTRLWSGTAYKVGGTIPFFDNLLSGSATYHRLLDP